MARSAALREHIAAGILDAATVVLGERGDRASMADIAEAAGVGRATLYRYFPNREALLTALAEAAFRELTERVAEARLDAVPVRAGIARMTRTFVGAVSKYRALTYFEKSDASPAGLEQLVIGPLRELFARG